MSSIPVDQVDPVDTQDPVPADDAPVSTTSDVGNGDPPKPM